MNFFLAILWSFFAGLDLTKFLAGGKTEYLFAFVACVFMAVANLIEGAR